MSEKNHCIDLNCDLGEYEFPEQGDNDAAIMPFISSCNIACGGHAGNTEVMAQTIRLAKAHQVAIGAHPSYPDRENFGRRPMDIPHRELKASIRDQILLLVDRANQQQISLNHVKPHGALYNQAAEDLPLATLLVETVAEIDNKLMFFGLAHSAMATAAEQVGVRFVAEAFADRAYTAHRTLVPRSQVGAVINDPDTMLSQILHMVRGQPIQAISGEWLEIQAQTICLHGDHPGSAITAKYLNDGLLAQDIRIQPPTHL
ncbi:MAG: 5-oxoprolinase subunit PxpA [Marinicella sp.]|nr:5-oxoprolinase subunit PxpA [Xanthomonadales bacterium]